MAGAGQRLQVASSKGCWPDPMPLRSVSVSAPEGCDPQQRWEDLRDLQHCFHNRELLYVARTGSSKAHSVNQKNQTSHRTESAASELDNLPLKFVVAWVQAGVQLVLCLWKGMVLMAEGAEGLQPPSPSSTSSYSSPPCH